MGVTTTTTHHHDGYSYWRHVTDSVSVYKIHLSDKYLSASDVLDTSEEKWPLMEPLLTELLSEGGTGERRKVKIRELTVF